MYQCTRGSNRNQNQKLGGADRRSRGRRLGIFGVAAALVLSVTAAPLPVWANGTCNDTSECGDNYNLDTTHTHEVIIVEGSDADRIAAGTFTNKVTCGSGSTISGGTFEREVTANSGSTISGGTFQNTFTGNGTKISGGNFGSMYSVTLTGDSVISNGDFHGRIELKSGTTTISGGTYGASSRIIVDDNATVKIACSSLNVPVELGGENVTLTCGSQGSSRVSQVLVDQYSSNAKISNMTIGNLICFQKVSLKDCIIDGSITMGKGANYIDEIDLSGCTLAENCTMSGGHTVTFVDSGTSSVTIVRDGKTVSNPDPTKTWYNGEDVWDFNTSVTSNLVLSTTPGITTVPGTGGSIADPGTGSSTGTRQTTVGSSKKHQTGHEDTEEAQENRIPAHTCQYEWVTVREAAPGTDGEEKLMCKLCGSVQAVLMIPAASYQTTMLYDEIARAGENATVTYDLENFHTISDKLLITLQNRDDITLILNFTYQGRQYQTTFPAGADYTELLEDETLFYGLLGVSGHCGIVTTEVADTADTAAE